MNPSFTYQKAIDASHPCEQADGSSQENLSFAADMLAMKLVGERYEKRDLVDLVRWLIMRKPEGLIAEGEQPAQRPLPAGTVIVYSGIVATVISDDGGPTIKVKTEGDDYEQNWFWELDGISCKVVALPPRD